jgi:hypothetical protein
VNQVEDMQLALFFPGIIQVGKFLGQCELEREGSINGLAHAADVGCTRGSVDQWGHARWWWCVRGAQGERRRAQQGGRRHGGRHSSSCTRQNSRGDRRVGRQATNSRILDDGGGRRLDERLSRLRLQSRRGQNGRQRRQHGSRGSKGHGGRCHRVGPSSVLWLVARCR